MAESVESLMRQGLISGRAAQRTGVLKAQRGTKYERPNEESFEGRQGLRDQGGVRDRGDTQVAGRDHINKKRTTRAGSPIASKPSKGGQAGKEAQVGTNEIDAGAQQRPAFPRGDRAKKSHDVKTPKRARGGVVQSGPEYGDPNSRKYG